jgi:hypothetical protein
LLLRGLISVNTSEAEYKPSWLQLFSGFYVDESGLKLGV